MITNTGIKEKNGLHNNELIHIPGQAICIMCLLKVNATSDWVGKNKQPVWILLSSFMSWLLLLGCWTLLVSCRVVLYAQLQGLDPALPFVPSCHNSCSEKLKFLQVQANYRPPKITLQLSCSGNREEQESDKLLGANLNHVCPTSKHLSCESTNFCLWKISQD